MIATIFDIDGTLIESFGFDGDCYINAVKEVLGEVHIYDDWGKYEKVTDSGILSQIMKENGINDNACVEKVKAILLFCCFSNLQPGVRKGDRLFLACKRAIRSC